MPNPTSRFLFFDLGNVLVRFDHSQMIDQLASVLNTESKAVYQAVFESGLQSEYERGQIDTGHFCEELRKITGVTPGGQPSDREIAHACSDIFSVNVSILPLVTALRSANFPIGILSNTCRAHWEHLLDSNGSLLRLFDTRVLSFEEGCAKPNPEIYRKAIQKTGLDPQQVFFVDDLMPNVQGAIDAGMDAVPFLSARQLVMDLRNRGVRINL